MADKGYRPSPPPPPAPISHMDYSGIESQSRSEMIALNVQVEKQVNHLQQSIRRGESWHRH